MFTLSEEHREIREAVRAVCEAKVASFAADVDVLWPTASHRSR